MKELKLAYWILGTLTAFAGVMMVRVVAPEYYAGDRTVLLFGYVLSTMGLFIIMIGTRKEE